MEKESYSTPGLNDTQANRKRILDGLIQEIHQLFELQEINGIIVIKVRNDILNSYFGSRITTLADSFDLYDVGEIQDLSISIIFDFSTWRSSAIDDLFTFIFLGSRLHAAGHRPVFAALHQRLCSRLHSMSFDRDIAIISSVSEALAWTQGDISSHESSP